MKICVVGQGAFGQKHLDALKRIPEVEITSLVGGNQDATAEVAKKYGVPHYTGDLAIRTKYSASSTLPAIRGAGLIICYGIMPPVPVPGGRNHFRLLRGAG